jgi:hypothetical protein
MKFDVPLGGEDSPNFLESTAYEVVVLNRRTLTQGHDEKLGFYEYLRHRPVRPQCTISPLLLT